MSRRESRKYYFSVEGETEFWYLEWLQKKINASSESKYDVSFDCSIEKNPLKRAKSLVVMGKTTIYHLSDYESDEDVHVREFTETMDNLKKARELGKQIAYKFGYSNLTFDLWIVLHKSDCNSSMIHRSKYLPKINSAYGENFESMKEYKHEHNFKRCLSKLSLQNVVEAVNRAESIMKANEENGYINYQYKGYRYYKENPSLLVFEPIKVILKDCGLYQGG